MGRKNVASEVRQMLGKIEVFFCSVMDVLNSMTILADELPSVLVGGTRCPNQDCDGYLIASPFAIQDNYAIAAAMQVAPVTLSCTRCCHEEPYLPKC